MITVLLIATNKWMMLAGDLESAQALLDVAKDSLKQEG
jgi:hypothetical protein